jgi:hypothetical protein
MAGGSVAALLPSAVATRTEAVTEIPLRFYSSRAWAEPPCRGTARTVASCIGGVAVRARKQPGMETASPAAAAAAAARGRGRG